MKHCTLLLPLPLLVIFAVVLFSYSASADDLADRASKIITKAGGPAIVCKEADQLFSQHGTSNLVFLSRQDLRLCPSLNAVGSVDGIWPGNPPFIKIRVGGHRTGFIMEIVRTNDIATPILSPSAVEVVKGRIYAHR